MAKVKITVVKKVNSKDMFGDNPPAEFTFSPECDQLEVGQEFIVGAGEYPLGLCPAAFADLQKHIAHLRYGGSYPWIKDKGVAISCCTDGMRPVIFKLERIED